jgi:hypothetical protein
MKICVRTFSHWIDAGLDLPERGECRWGLNLAKLLAKIGHEVYLLVDEKRSEVIAPYGINVCTMDTIGRFGLFDIYLDPNWTFHERALAPCKYYIANLWFPQNWTDKVPDSVIKVFPYTWMRKSFEDTGRSTANLFCLPSPFGERFIDPRENSRDQILFCAKNLLELPGNPSYERDRRLARRILNHLQSNYPSYKVNLTFVIPGLFESMMGKWENCEVTSNLTYDKVRDICFHGRLSTPILGPSCVLDAIFQGCPSLLWKSLGENPLEAFKDSYCWNTAGEKYGLTIDSTFSNLETTIDTMLTNDEKTSAYVRNFQLLLSEHLEENVLKFFDSITKRLDL